MTKQRKNGQLYIKKHIDEYHRAQLASLNGLDIKKILKRKNPYLFKAKNLQMLRCDPTVMDSGVPDACSVTD
jgi:hypothetical protein